MNHKLLLAAILGLGMSSFAAAAELPRLAFRKPSGSHHESPCPIHTRITQYGAIALILPP